MSTPALNGAQLLVRCLEKHSVKLVFGIPGAKIDAAFDALCGSSIRLILCRHEQNAAFMAAAYGRITGEPGVVLVTSGPGIGNLTTGLLTATTEGDPVIAIGGSVPRNMLLKNSHQSADNTRLMEAATKKSVMVTSTDTLPEVIENAFRIAKAPRRGAYFISIPQDVLLEQTEDSEIRIAQRSFYGQAPEEDLSKAVKVIELSKLPILFLGEEASRQENVPAIRALIKKYGIPSVSTFQGAGVLSRDLFSNFAGRVGLFKNQPGDRLLEQADTVITVGYNPVEYDPEYWNPLRNKQIIHVDSIPAMVESHYQPTVELLGNISSNIQTIAESAKIQINSQERQRIAELHQELQVYINSGLHREFPNNGKIHPLQFIQAFRAFINDEDLVMCDIGSVYMWMARYFFVYTPRQIFFSNGQQTLGVALPWAMAAKLACPEKRIFSISGDGGFLFSSMELETAVRENLPFIHFIWTDHTYNMVLEQQLLKYDRPSGVELGSIDIISYAAAFGAKGYRLTSIHDFQAIMEDAMRQTGPVLIDIPMDYSDNREMFVEINEGAHC